MGSSTVAKAASFIKCDATPGGSKVLYLRQNYHFGAGKIRDYLKRFTASASGGVPLAVELK